MPAKTRPNLFTLLLVPIGLLFVVTASAYAWMTVNGAPAAAGRNAAHPLFQWLRAHGDGALLAELVILALVTVGVIATDKADDRRSSTSGREARESRE